MSRLSGTPEDSWLSYPTPAVLVEVRVGGRDGRKRGKRVSTNIVPVRVYLQNVRFEFKVLEEGAFLV